MDDSEAIDRRFMALAVRMGARGLGSTAPNPAVGAVIVRIGGECPPQVVARGWTQPGGRPHAETEAIRRAGDGSRGATLYVTLEPCSHHGRTPPCAEAVIAAGIARVVVALPDPDPKVAGAGLARLRGAGIEVTTGVFAEVAAWGLAGHILHRRLGRPFVQLKLAVSADGRVARGAGAPVWVTGPEARAAGHLLRAAADAILVGRGTLEADDPELTCRLPGLEHRSPLPVVLDSALRLDPGCRLVRTRGAQLFVACSDGIEASRLNRFTRSTRANVLPVPRATGRGLDPASVLRALADRGMTRLLIEGGPAVAASFLSTGLVDEAVVFRSPDTLGTAGLPALAAPGGLAMLEDAAAWSPAGTRVLGRDRMTVYRRMSTISILSGGLAEDQAPCSPGS